MKTEKYYTIAIGSYCKRNPEIHETEQAAKTHAEEENQLIINDVFAGNRNAWSDDAESTEYKVYSESEAKKDFPELFPQA